MKIFIIDGFHRGQLIDWHEPMPSIRLLKPPVKITCICDDVGSENDGWESDSREIEYFCCMRSVDGELALFSTTGKSEDILRNRDTIVQTNFYKKEEPIRVNCNDPRAFSR